MAQSGVKGFAPNLNTAPEDLPDSLLFQNKDSTKISIAATTAYRLTDKTGERYIAPMDTMRMNFFNNILIDGRGVSTGYLANIGSPAQSRIFFERPEGEDFIFADAFSYYITNPKNALFYDVKDPYTRLTYTRAGGQTNREEMFNGVLTTNFGKSLNIGADFDYTYSRGQYTSNGNNLLYYRLFGSYLTDRYEVNMYFRNYNYVVAENGGLTNDRYVTHPDDFTDGKRPLDPKSFPTKITDTWNRIKSKQLFLTHRYNLGFYRELTDREKEEAEQRKEVYMAKEERVRKRSLKSEIGGRNIDDSSVNPVQSPSGISTEEQEGSDETEEPEIPEEIFVPVSSIFHTFEYESNSRRFISTKQDIDSTYIKGYNSPLYASPDSLLDDYFEAWTLKNILGLSLREGFQDWVKFGLAAYINFEKRRFTIPSDSLKGTEKFDEFSTYLGGELSKQQGKILTYKATGELCILGSDIGEFRINGELNTRFNIMGKDASIKANGYIKNLTPAFFMRHNHSRYFWWDIRPKNIQRVYAGGEIGIEQTRTNISAGVESIQNFCYFSQKGIPETFEGNLQVITARLKQNFKYKALGWENEVVWQVSSEKSILPLPQICAYSNLYLDFRYAKVLQIQLGADVHYFTSYYAPYYEPANQQFQTQSEKKIGNYPIINAYANFNLKQARFFISGYNLGSMLITPTDYFSLLHYPLNPMTIKLGISVFFKN